MTHSFASYLASRYFCPAAFAHLALEAYALILSAGALPVLLGSEDLLTVQTVLIGLLCSVVNGLGIFYLSVAPVKDLSGRCKPDLY